MGLRSGAPATIVMAALCAVGGAAFLPWVVPEATAGLATYGWQRTEGTVLQAGVAFEMEWDSFDGYENYWLDLRYAYDTPGSEAGATLHHTGRRWDVSTAAVDRPHLNTPFVRRVMARHVIDQASSVPVFYDPERPGRSVLVRGVPAGTLGLLLPCLGLLATAVYLLRVHRRRPTRAPASAQGALLFGLVGPLLYCVLGGLYYCFVYMAVGEAFHVLVPNAIALLFPIATVLFVVCPASAKMLSWTPVRRAAGVAMVAAPIVVVVALVRGIAFNADDPYLEPADELLVAQLREPSVERRSWATYYLVRKSRRPAAAIAALRDSLRDPSADMRSTAIYGLRHYGRAATSAVPDLLDLARDADRDVRTQAVEALLELTEDRLVCLPVAIELLGGDVEQRRQAMRLLRGLGPRAEPARDRLLALLEVGEDRERRDALSVLDRLRPRPRRAIPAAVALLESDSRTSRFVALRFLARMEPLDAAATSAVDRLIALLDSTTSEERRQAMRVLAALGAAAKRAVPRLRELAVGGPQSSQKADAEAARAALRRLGAAPIR